MKFSPSQSIIFIHRCQVLIRIKIQKHDRQFLQMQFYYNLRHLAVGLQRIIIALFRGANLTVALKLDVTNDIYIERYVAGINPERLMLQTRK